MSEFAQTVKPHWFYACVIEQVFKTTVWNLWRLRICPKRKNYWFCPFVIETVFKTSVWIAWRPRFLINPHKKLKICYTLFTGSTTHLKHFKSDRGCFILCWICSLLGGGNSGHLDFRGISVPRYVRQKQS